MATHPKPVTHVFKEINEGKYATVKHYELQEVQNGTTLLTNQINISKNRNFAKSMPVYWVKVREGKKWSKKCITGLFKTNLPILLKGDIDHKKHLVLFKFSNGISDLTVYYFKDFYTKDISSLVKKYA